MTQEEKARAYDEAKARMSRAFNSNRCTIGFMNEIFPELAESEDEKIRKEFCKDIWNYIPYEKAHKYIAWLEKQGDKSVNIDIESMVSSYKQRLKSQGGVENIHIVDMCLTAFRHGVENVLEELNLKKLEKE